MEPVEVEIKLGLTEYVCICGKTKGTIFCDGSHPKGVSPKPVKFTLEQ